MNYLWYGLVLLPWGVEFLETGHLPATFREATTEVCLSLLIVVGILVLIRQQRRLKDLTSEMDRRSSMDPLTSLGNTQSLQETLVREIARTRRVERPLSCVLMDLDDFRMINDQYGHEKGNGVLQTVAGTIKTVIRQDVDRAFRYGGDEFLVILPEAEGQQALAIAQRLREALIDLKPPTIPKRALPVCIALAQLREDQRAHDLLRSLDRAMVKAKAQGKNMIYDARLLE